MFTILMKNDKSLVVTTKEVLHQRDSLVNKIRFLIPYMYENQDLRNYTVLLKYLDQGNVPHVVILTKEIELYKDEFIVCKLPVSSTLSQFAGDIELRLTLTYEDSSNIEYTLHTGVVKITIEPTQCWFLYKNGSVEKDLDDAVPDTSRDVIYLEPDSVMTAGDGTYDLTGNDSSGTSATINNDYSGIIDYGS